MRRGAGSLAVVGLGLVLGAGPVMAEPVGEPVVHNQMAQAVLSFAWSPLRLVARMLPEHKSGLLPPETDRDSALFAGD